MTWMLDSNACIRYLNGRAAELKTRIDATAESDIVVCSVVKAELFYGAARSNDPPRAMANQQLFLSRFISLVFDDYAAEAYGRIRGDLAARGLLIGPNDLLIAAIAVVNNITLVTHNSSEFRRVAGLRIEDWEI